MSRFVVRKTGYAWSPKDIKSSPPRPDPQPVSYDRPNKAGLLVIEDVEVEAHLPNELSDEAIRSMDEYADSQRGKTSVGSTRKL